MRISVFITSYNQRDLLKEAVDSVLAQTRPASQIVIVDDASGDGSQELIQTYASSHPGVITPVLREQNGGVAQARIDALRAITGDHVTYVDGDDRFLPHKLEAEAAALEAAPAAGIAFSNNRYMSEDWSEELYTWIDGEPVPQGDVFFETFTRKFPRRSLFRMELVRYAAWREIGFHDPTLRIYEDFDMRIRLTKKLRAVYADTVTSEIRTHGAGLSKSPDLTHLACLRHLAANNAHLLDDLTADRRREAQIELKVWIARIAARGSLAALRKGAVIDASSLAAGAARIACGRLRQ
ncbi:MAG: glycosyltransferase family 2 protein [Alphaproteobacteria bacterium]|nr:glycosyltransferase family 2 protein [Alphaproteobacteria bacterium]